MYIAILTDVYPALFTSFWQRYEMLYGYSLYFQSKFPGNFLDDDLKFVLVNIIACVINIQCFT